MPGPSTGTPRLPPGCHTRGVAGPSPADPPTVPPAVRPTVRRACALAVAFVVATACGGDDGAGDAERFCGEIGADPAAVVAPSLASDDELDATLDHYRTLADLAPIAIEAEWRDLVLNLETASTVVPGDDDSVQRAVAQAYATERSAVRVRDWLLANCSIDLGPVATLVPHDRVRPALDDPGSDEPGDVDDAGDVTGDGEAPADG